MKPKKKYKHYIYMRDNQRCFFCGRRVDYHKMSMDHYQPKAKGGSDNLFNIVTSCASCNKNKGIDLPIDYREIQIKLFETAVHDGIFRLPSSEHIETIQTIDVKTVEFRSKGWIYTIKENILTKSHKV